MAKRKQVAAGTLAEKDMIWKEYVSNETDEEKREYLDKLFLSQTYKSIDMGNDNESRAHARSLISLIKVEKEKLEL